MIVNKTDRALDRNKFYYQDEELEVVKGFDYLGLLIASSFSVKNLLDDLYGRGLKVYFKLRNCLEVNFRDHAKLSLDLFDGLVKLTLIYGIELWGCLKQGFNNKNPIENLNIKLCKHSLGVRKRASNVDSRCELERKQLHISGFKVGNWVCIINDPINVIPKTIYTENVTNRLTWTQNLKEIIVKHGLGDIWAISHNNTVNE